MDENFKEQLEYGKDFERRFSQHLINYGYSVIPFFLLNKEGAPLLLGQENTILPDILTYKDGKGVWFECKRKSRMSDNFTGYNMHNHKHYKEIQKITDSKVYVIFEDKNEWYGNFIDVLEKKISTKIKDIQNEPHILYKYPESFIRIKK